MATSIRETILDNVVTRMEAITTGSGYEQTVSKCYRPHVGAFNITEYPAVVLQVLQEGHRRHVRLAYEIRMRIGLRCYIESSAEEDRNEQLQDLMGDVVKAMQTDETWSGKAIGTEVLSMGTVEDEIVAPAAVGIVEMEILYRVKRDDPYTVKVI